MDSKYPPGVSGILHRLHAPRNSRDGRIRWGMTLWIANLGLLGVLGSLLWGLWRERVTDRPPAALAVSSNVEPTPPPAVPADPRPEAIVTRNIFGSGKAVGSAESASSLQVRLLGTVAGDPAIARAVLEDATTKLQSIYRVGDTVLGAQIERIERNRVVLSRAGRREVLELAALPASSPGPEAARAESPSPSPAAADAREAIRATGPSQFEVSRKALQARVGGMEAVLKAARLEPFVVDGKTLGLKLSGVENISMARFVGLENGDVIQSVNGQELSSMQKAFQVFQKARSQPSLNVELLRGQSRKTLSFNLGAEP